MEIEEFFAPPLKNPVKPPLTMGTIAHDSNHSAKVNGLLRWLGIGGGDHSVRKEADELASNPSEARSLGWRDKRRRQLLEDIFNFLLTHRLEVSANTLDIAYDVISGGNSKLTKLVEERILSREPVTLVWPEEAARPSNPDGDEKALNTLMTKLESRHREF
jgi:hypothetical protein